VGDDDSTSSIAACDNNDIGCALPEFFRDEPNFMSTLTKE